MSQNKVYAETRGAKRFNWFEELAKRIKKNSGPIVKLSKKAESWTTCACGNQCAALPRTKDGEPLDHELSELGVDFFNKVHFASWHDALDILKKIELRSFKLLMDQEVEQLLKN